jgi:hypothetical protein
MRHISANIAFALILFAPVAAEAQYDSHWNASGPHPDTCIYNGVQFYPDDEVCVRPGVRQTCELDGTLGPPESDLDCKAAQASVRSITHSQGRSDVACTFGDKRFSVGAEICSAGGSKVVCGPTGVLGAATRETTCRAPLSSGE